MKEYWLIDLNNNKCLEYCKAKNLKEAKKVFSELAKVENYTLTNCVITIASVYYN